MPVIDLTHPLNVDTPLFPGTPPPMIEDVATLDVDGYREKRISLHAHTGTHIDAPAHIIEDGPTLDRLPVDVFWGSALVFDCSGHPVIGLDGLLPMADRLRHLDFLILATGWHRHWGQPRYFADFPVLSQKTAEWLVETGLKGIGVDALSVDPLDDTRLPVHHILLGAGMVIVENLANLDRLPEGSFHFSCLPLAIQDADGSPVRAVAVL